MNIVTLLAAVVIGTVAFVWLLWFFLPRIKPAKRDVVRILRFNRKHKFLYFKEFPHKKISVKKEGLDFEFSYEPDDIYENTMHPVYRRSPVTWRYLTLLEGMPDAAGNSTFKVFSHRTLDTYEHLMRLHAINRTQKIEQKLIYVNVTPWMLVLMVGVVLLFAGFIGGIVAGPHLSALSGGVP